MTETNRIEFKRELMQDLDIEREVVAFLNYRECCTVYDGVNDEFGSVNGSVNDVQPTQRQLNILSLIAKGQKVGSVNGSVTTNDIIAKLNISERTVYRELAALKQMGLIRRIGSDKTGHWEVINFENFQTK